MKQTTQARRTARSLRQRCVRALKEVARVVLFAVVLYLVIVLIGLIPVNNDFEPSPDGVEILLISNPVHADVVLPIDTKTIDWREHFPADSFSGDTSDATHVAIGWGDRGFFIETPTWADLRVSTATNALFLPSESCMHVSFTKAEHLRKRARSVTISGAQHQRLVEYINASFQHAPDGSKIQLGNLGYGPNDAFFEAHGYYHCLNTCNSWAGRAMRAAGIRTGWSTPLPKTTFLYLPE